MDTGQGRRLLGRYSIYERLASGGMASVYFGRLVGPVGFGRTVAIKRMHAQFAEDLEFVSMFLDEARVAARIRHPNVVQTLDIVTTDGELFIVMEYVEGEVFSRLIRASNEKLTPLPPRLVTTVMTGILHGLKAAHDALDEQGEPLRIVHRDVSPQNILVGTDGVARLLDFGVAKATGRLISTKAGEIKGKLGYMAPEQVRGETTLASDIYSASVVMWEALTGTRAFKGENNADVLARVLQGNQVPPSALVSDVPPALDRIIMKGMSVEPKDRFASAEEMARALEDVIPPFTVTKVGQWVASLAADAIAARRAVVERMERDVQLVTAEPPSSRPALAAQLLRTPEAPRQPANEDPDLSRIWDPTALRAPRATLPSARELTEVDVEWVERNEHAPVSRPPASSSSAAGVELPTPGSDHRRRARVVLSTSLVLALVGAWLLLHAPSGGMAQGGAAPPLIATAAAASPTAPSPVRSLPRPSPSESSPSAAEVPSNASNLRAPPQIASEIDLPEMDVPENVVTRRPKTFAKPTTTKSLTKPAMAPVTCDPPYTINEAGHRVPKPECP